MKKRIALISAFYPYRGGIAQFSANLYRALENENEVSAFTFIRQYPNFLFPGKTQMVEENDKADPIPATRVIDTFNPFSFRKAAKRISLERPEVILTQYWMPFFAPALGTIHRYFAKKNVKRVAVLHNVIPHEKKFYDKGANKFFLKHNDGFVVLSDSVLQDLLSLKPEAKVLRLDHPAYEHFGEGIERIDALSQLGLDSEKKYILFFGFIRKYKGLDVLINALSSLPEEMNLIVAGEPYEDFSSYQQIIDEFGLQDRVHVYTDYIADDEVKTFFSAADVCVLPYRSATQSGITAISHHFCLPVISTNVGGLAETISHQEDGLIVEKAEPELISAAIKHYFEENLTVDFTAKLKLDKSKKSWSHFSQELLRFIEEL